MKLSFLLFVFSLVLVNLRAQNLKVEYDRIIKEDLNGSLPAESSDVFKNKVIEELKKPTKEILYVLGILFTKVFLKHLLLTRRKVKKSMNTQPYDQKLNIKIYKQRYII